MVRSLERQLKVPLGFRPEGVTVSRASLPASRYNPAAQKIFVERAAERLREIPGVTSATVATSLPFTGNTSAGRMLPDIATDPSRQLRYFRTFVAPSFFDTLGIAIKQGRGFTSSDRAGAPAVAIINESGAKRIWGTSNAVGRRFRTGSPEPFEIVGVAADARFRSLRTDFAIQAEPELYFPYAQRSDRDIEFAVRSDGGTVPLAALQQAIAAIDQGLPLYAVQPLTQAVSQQTATERFGSSLLTIFSVATLLLAAIGLYGLVAYVVGLSRQEIAIRLALGADSWRVVTLIVRNGMTLVIAGIVLGLGGAILAGRSLQTQLFQTRAADPATLATVALLLGFVALVASLLPTFRAVRVAPHSALRAE
jgi:putative ABC transport system permease protein